MPLKIWIINIALAVLAGYLGVNAAKEWSRDAAFIEQPPPSNPEAQKPPASQKASTTPARVMPAKESFNVVVEKNLFASEREEIKEEAKPPPSPQQTKPAQPEPEPVKVTFTLYGIIAAKGVKKALLSFSEEQPSGKKPRPQERQAKGATAQWYEIGEGEESWKLASIDKDSVVVTVGKDKTVVHLYDKEKPKQRGPAAARSQGPTVITVATQSAAAGQLTVVGEKGAAKEYEGSESEARSPERGSSEEKKKTAASTSRIGTGLSTRGSGESALRKESVGRSDTTGSYPPSRLPPFVRQR